MNSKLMMISGMDNGNILDFRIFQRMYGGWEEDLDGIGEWERTRWYD